MFNALNIYIQMHYGYIYTWSVYVFTYLFIHTDQDVKSDVNVTKEDQPTPITQDTHNGMQ